MSRPRDEHSGSSLDTLNLDDDEFNQQDVTSVLPPSTRARRETEQAAADSVLRSQQSLAIWSGRKPPPRASALKRQDQRGYYYDETDSQEAVRLFAPHAQQRLPPKVNRSATRRAALDTPLQTHRSGKQSDHQPAEQPHPQQQSLPTEPQQQERVKGGPTYPSWETAPAAQEPTERVSAAAAAATTMKTDPWGDGGSGTPLDAPVEAAPFAKDMKPASVGHGHEAFSSPMMMVEQQQRRQQRQSRPNAEEAVSAQSDTKESAVVPEANASSQAEIPDASDMPHEASMDVEDRLERISDGKDWPTQQQWQQSPPSQGTLPDPLVEEEGASPAHEAAPWSPQEPQRIAEEDKEDGAVTADHQERPQDHVQGPSHQPQHEEEEYMATPRHLATASLPSKGMAQRVDDESIALGVAAATATLHSHDAFNIDGMVEAKARPPPVREAATALPVSTLPSTMQVKAPEEIDALYENPQQPESDVANVYDAPMDPPAVNDENNDTFTLREAEEKDSGENTAMADAVLVARKEMGNAEEERQPRAMDEVPVAPATGKPTVQGDMEVSAAHGDEKTGAPHDRITENARGVEACIDSFQNQPRMLEQLLRDVADDTVHSSPKDAAAAVADVGAGEGEPQESTEQHVQRHEAENEEQEEVSDVPATDGTDATLAEAADMHEVPAEGHESSLQQDDDNDSDAERAVPQTSAPPPPSEGNSVIPRAFISSMDPDMEEKNEERVKDDRTQMQPHAEQRSPAPWVVVARESSVDGQPWQWTGIATRKVAKASAAADAGDADPASSHSSSSTHPRDIQDNTMAPEMAAATPEAPVMKDELYEAPAVRERIHTAVRNNYHEKIEGTVTVAATASRNATPEEDGAQDVDFIDPLRVEFRATGTDVVQPPPPHTRSAGPEESEADVHVPVDDTRIITGNEDPPMESTHREGGSARRGGHNGPARPPLYRSPTSATHAYDPLRVHGEAAGEAGLTAVTQGLSQKMTADELQDARLRAYNEAGTVSTLDFLRDTSDSVLPDVVQSMFAATSTFFRTGTDAVAQSVPEPLREAAKKTGRRLALLADFTGDLLTNAPEYVMTFIPDYVVSQETKQLLSVDFLSVMKVSLNVNILAVPYVFRMAGLLGGLLILTSTHLICYYNTWAFFEAKNQLRHASAVIMYGDVPRMTWGKWCPMISLWYSAAFLIAHITYAASNLQVLLATMGITGSTSTALAFIMPSVLSLPLVFMKRASTQKPMAAIASLLVFVGVVLFITVFPYKSVDAYKRVKPRLWPKDAPEFFVALGIAAYILCPLRTAVPVERSMDSKRFMRLLAVAMSIAFACHLIFGLCAFVTLQADTCSVLAVSLPNGPVETAAASVMFFAFLFIIPLAQFRIGEVCDRRVLGVRTLPSYWQMGPNIMRMLFLTGAILVAHVLPHYGLLVGLGGSFGCGIVGFVVPSALDYVRRERLRLRTGRHLMWWEYAIVFSGILFGAIGVVLLGVIFSLYQLWLVNQGGYKQAC